MSSIGVGNVGSVHLAGSVSGGQQVKAERDQAKADSSRQDFKATLESISSQHAENVDETSLGADRDADGRRMDDGFSDTESQSDHDTPTNSATQPVNQVNKSQDAFGERGVNLDLEA